MMKKANNNDRERDINNMPKSEFKELLTSPPSWAISHSRKYGDILNRIITEQYPISEKSLLIEQWVNKYGADPFKQKDWSAIASKYRPDSTKTCKISETPISYAIKKRDIKTVNLFLSKPWRDDIHGAVFAFCCKNKDDEMMNILWSKNENIHKIKNIDLEDVLWSEKWTTRFLNKGKYLSKETNIDNLNRWFQYKNLNSYSVDQNTSATNRLALKKAIDVFYLIDNHDKNGLKVQSKKKTKSIPINWHEVLNWGAQFNDDNTFIYVIKHTQIDPSILLFKQISNSKRDTKEMLKFLEATLPFVDEKMHKYIINSMSNKNPGNIIKSDKGLIENIIKRNKNYMISVINKTIEFGFKKEDWLEALKNRCPEIDEDNNTNKTPDYSNVKKIRQASRNNIIEVIAEIEKDIITKHIKDYIGSDETNIVKKRKII